MIWATAGPVVTPMKHESLVRLGSPLMPKLRGQLHAAKREKVVDKSGTKFLSSYKEQTFTYDITIRNNKKEEINLTLKDQYPLSSDKDITIELLEDGKASVNPETGFMTWDLKLAPNESKKIRISFKVRYPKDKIIDNL